MTTPVHHVPEAAVVTAPTAPTRARRRAPRVHHAEPPCVPQPVVRRHDATIACQAELRAAEAALGPLVLALRSALDSHTLDGLSALTDTRAGVKEALEQAGRISRGLGRALRHLTDEIRLAETRAARAGGRA